MVSFKILQMNREAEFQFTACESRSSLGSFFGFVAGWVVHTVLLLSLSSPGTANQAVPSVFLTLTIIHVCKHIETQECKWK